MQSAVVGHAIDGEAPQHDGLAAAGRAAADVDGKADGEPVLAIDNLGRGSRATA